MYKIRQQNASSITLWVQKEFPLPALFSRSARTRKCTASCFTTRGTHKWSNQNSNGQAMVEKGLALSQPGQQLIRCLSLFQPFIQSLSKTCCVFSAQTKGKQVWIMSSDKAGHLFLSLPPSHPICLWGWHQRKPQIAAHALHSFTTVSWKASGVELIAQGGSGWSPGRKPKS